MKKIFLSITAFTFCATVSFAQTETGIQEDQQQEELQVERLSEKPEMAGKNKIEMSELPAGVQQSFQESEFKDWKVAEVYELQAADSPEGQEGMPTEEEAAYEILLISQDLKEEIADTRETVAEEKKEAQTDEEVEISTEKVMVEVPAVVLQYDKEGKLLKQEERPETNETELQEQY